MGDVLFSFLAPRTLLALLGGAAAALTILYLLKLRRRRAPVPFLPLWAEATSDSQSSALLRRLRRVWSLLLALVFAALLALAAADPRPAAEAEGARTVVLLVDTSASMQATDVAPAASRLARAVELALVYVDALRPADAAMLVRVDGQVAPLTPFTQDRDVLREALRGLRATDTRADFGAALGLAADALVGLPGPTVAVFSDLAVRNESATGLPDLAARGVAVELFAVGSSGRNAGIVAFSVRRWLADRTAFEVYGAVKNFHTEPLRVAARLYLDGVQVGERHLEIEPGATAGLVEEALTVGDAAHEGRLTVRITLDDASGAAATGAAATGAAGAGLREAAGAGAARADASGASLRDDLPADDIAYAVVPPHAKVRALLVGRENLFLEAALVVGESVDYERVPCEGFDVTRAAKYDLTILDGCTPPGLATATAGRFLWLDAGATETAPAPGAAGKAGAAPAPAKPGKPPAPAAAAPAAFWKTEPPLAFPRLTIAPGRTKHPILRWVSLKDVAVAEARPLVPAPGRGDEALILAATTAGSTGKPILVARSEGALRAVGLGVDIRRSDLPIRVAFPLLVLNTIDWLTWTGDDAYRASLRAGQVFRVPLANDSAAPLETAEVTLPSGLVRAVPVHDGHAVLYGAERGFYVLRTKAESMLLAANLADPDESDIRPASPAPIAGVPGIVATRASVAGDWWRWLLVAALFLTLVEWWTYNRRLTV